MGKRYYCHGDEHESQSGSYYCAFCDAFENQHHFELHSERESNLERYNRSQIDYKKMIKNNAPEMYRHSTTNNLFKNLPQKEVSKKGRFYRWLLKQIDRDDPIGDLAKDSHDDSTYPIDIDSKNKIKSHLIYKSACDEVLQAFEEAWNEFNKRTTSRSGISLGKRFEVFRADDYKCQICGASVKEGARLEVDHKVPKSKGGSDDLENLWTLCFKCNRGKRDRDL